MHTFTDAEQRFADSPEGLTQIAKARREFELRNAHMGDRAPQWTDAMTAGVVQQACRDSARSAITNAAALASAQRQEPIARAARDAALAARKDRISNAWRGD